MYYENPQEYLTKTNSINISPIENKNDKNNNSSKSLDKSLERLDKEHKLKVEDILLENKIEEEKWRSCCFDLHPQSSLFFGKLGVSCLVIILCSYQLITLKDCNYQSLYSSLLSSVITFWLTKK
jgi:hypothetical protein